MAHFAELDSNNVVTRVIVVANSDVLDSNGKEDESVGIEYLKGLFGESTNWKQTSYNGTQRVRYAGKGFTYDPSRNVFLIPQPHPSWTVNETTTEWDSPILRQKFLQEKMDIMNGMKKHTKQIIQQDGYLRI